MKIGQFVRDNVVSTSNWSNFERLSRRAGLSAIAGLSCSLFYRIVFMEKRDNKLLELVHFFAL